MTSVFKGLLKPSWQPQKCSIRFRVKFNLLKPKPRHFVREVTQTLCKPFYPRVQPQNPEERIALCQVNVKRIEIDNPYVHLLAKDILNWFQKNNSIFFFHRVACTKQDYYEMLMLLKKSGLSLRSHERSVMEEALKGTIYEPALPLFQAHTDVGAGQDVNVKQLLSTTKKCYYLTLMAGICDNKFMSLSDLKRYADLPNIQTLRSSFCASLSAIGGSTVGRLNHHQNTLVQNLKQHVELSQGEKKS